MYDRGKIPKAEVNPSTTKIDVQTSKQKRCVAFNRSELGNKENESAIYSKGRQFVTEEYPATGKLHP